MSHPPTVWTWIKTWYFIPVTLLKGYKRLAREGKLNSLQKWQKEWAKYVYSRMENKERYNYMKLSFSIKLNFHIFSWLTTLCNLPDFELIFLIPQCNGISSSQDVYLKNSCQVDLNLLLMQMLYFQLDTEVSTHDVMFHLKIYSLNSST